MLREINFLLNFAIDSLLFSPVELLEYRYTQVQIFAKR